MVGESGGGGEWWWGRVGLRRHLVNIHVFWQRESSLPFESERTVRQLRSVHLVHDGATAAANSARVPQRLKQHWRSETANNGYVKRHSGDYPFLNARGVK